VVASLLEALVALVDVGTEDSLEGARHACAQSGVGARSRLCTGGRESAEKVHACLSCDVSCRFVKAQRGCARVGA
jgi:hypothetical protein